jgi:hypothetical protein
MAVIQISKIQVRRGLQENLPQLASGEMGWSVDDRRLWIGNGTSSEGAPEEGNTEILTARTELFQVVKSYTFHGAESGYVSQTGPSAFAKVVRTLQSKLDDQISFRDFITPEDITLNDYTDALQRAIDQVFPAELYSTVGVRRQLHIPAGVYTITSNITIPPFANIQGDGPRSTIIKKTFGIDSVIRLRDSSGELGVNVDTDFVDAPFEITFSNLTLQSDVESDVALLESCQYVKFNYVRFQGGTSAPVTLGAGNSAVAINDTAAATTQVTLNNCEFSNVAVGVTLIGEVTSVTVTESLFNNLYRGVVATANIASPQGIKVIASQFDNIAAESIFSDDDSSVTSAFNYYRNVGLSDGVVVVTATATSAVLSWNTANNYSIGDVFERSEANQLVYSLIETGSDQTASLTQATTAGSVQDSPGATITLIDNTTANTVVALSPLVSSAIIDYKIVRGDHKRVGTIKVSHFDGTNVEVDDEYTESSDLGIAINFTGNVTSQSAILGYTSTATGDDATFKYAIRSFI